MLKELATPCYSSNRAIFSVSGLLAPGNNGLFEVSISPWNISSGPGLLAPGSNGLFSIPYDLSGISPSPWLRVIAGDGLLKGLAEPCLLASRPRLITVISCRLTKRISPL